jgi:hypothetical protein
MTEEILWDGEWVAASQTFGPERKVTVK